MYDIWNENHKWMAQLSMFKYLFPFGHWTEEKKSVSFLNQSSFHLIGQRTVAPGDPVLVTEPDRMYGTFTSSQQKSLNAIGSGSV